MTSRLTLVWYLISSNFDEFLEPVYNEEMVLVVVVGDVTGVEPLVRTDGLRGGLRVVEVPFHHLLSSKLFPSHLLGRERHKPVEYQFAYLK